MTLDYETYAGKSLGTQVQIAHKRARFLRLYLQTYQKYHGYRWYWNAGEYPTQRIIKNYPHLIHSMNQEFGATGQVMCPILYLDNTKDWREKFFAVHLLMRGNTIRNPSKWCFPNRKKPSILDFDEQNVKRLETTFGQMARLILYNTTELILN